MVEGISIVCLLLAAVLAVALVLIAFGLVLVSFVVDTWRRL